MDATRASVMVMTLRLRCPDISGATILQFCKRLHAVMGKNQLKS